MKSLRIESRHTYLPLKNKILGLLAGLLVALFPSRIQAQTIQPVRQGSDISFGKEVQHAINKGLGWLQANQNTNGCWSTTEQPAVTALALSAFMGEPSGRFQRKPTAPIQRGYQFILKQVKADGSIYERDLQNYNTAICSMALISAQNPAYDSILRRARQWLIGQQTDFKEKGGIDSPFDGGIGYGDKYQHSDLNNTLTALEALYYSKHLERDKKLAGAKELDWNAAIHFLQSCQNLPSHNKETWASDDPKNKGGFIYFPGESKAGAETNSAGRVALRSYGSISYAGLLSYIYADLKRDDPRVQAAFKWLRSNFSLEENPGMGPQGFYYYLHLMTKTLALYGVDKLELKGGKEIDWRKEVAMKLINLQKADGSWANDNGRWWEKDPALVTAYAVMSLEIIYRGL
jgi:squalene-hopene/tetraprenyl-beta-curcumene cyclase